ncbi:hypothetical protein JB92DRAFT_2828035 [Gautieria morchelliformis]|nr:hypothetical protein JB92DRAFT_2828035 [Gautieria morchelliformis]
MSVTNCYFAEASDIADNVQLWLTVNALAFLDSLNRQDEGSFVELRRQQAIYIALQIIGGHIGLPILIAHAVHTPPPLIVLTTTTQLDPVCGFTGIPATEPLHLLHLPLTAPMSAIRVMQLERQKDAFAFGVQNSIGEDVETLLAQLSSFEAWVIYIKSIIGGHIGLPILLLFSIFSQTAHRDLTFLMFHMDIFRRDFLCRLIGSAHVGASGALN